MSLATPKPPSIHARAVITWLAIFPLVTLFSYILEPFAGEWTPLERALVLTVLVVPVAVYLIVPRLMQAYGAAQRARSRRRE